MSFESSLTKLLEVPIVERFVTILKQAWVAQTICMIKRCINN